MYNSFDIRRTYGIGGIVFEIFDVVDAITEEVLVNITMYAPKKSSSVFSYRLCTPSSLLRISIRSSVYENWYAGSKLEVISFDGNNDILFSGRLDTLAGLSQIHFVDVSYIIRPLSNWHYHFDSFPVDWESSESVEDWKESSVFPPSSNQIQLFKKLFNLSVIPDSPSIHLSIRYQEGIAIFINGKVLFVNHLPSTPITESTLASGSYTNCSYHEVFLPQHYLQDNKYVSYFKEGTNVITVAIIHSSKEPFQTPFDLYMRFTGKTYQYRSFGMTAEISGLVGKPESLLDIDHESWVDMNDPMVPDASIIVQFPPSRREVINKVVLVNYFHDLMNGPTGFDIYGREEADSKWIFLQHVESILWKKTSQQIAFWINSEVALNGIKLTHFTVDEAISWRLSEILLFSEQLNREIPTFSYQDVEQYQDVEIITQFPPSPDYFNFHVVPELPSGLTLDLMDGELKGIPEFVSETSEYVITATRFDSQYVSCTLKITIPYCSGDRSLYHVSVMADKHIDESYWKLYEGKDIHGKELFNSVTVPEEEVKVWSFCLPFGYYTLFFMGRTYGWIPPAGFTIATNHDNFPFYTGTLPSNLYQPNSTVTVTIHTKQILQPLTTEWRLAPATEPIDSAWKEINYSASLWMPILLKDLSDYPSDYPSFYLRKEFVIEDLTEFNLLVFQCQFSGGLIVYLNAYPIFRVNLPEVPSRHDYSRHDHNSSQFSEFSVPLLGSSAVEGKNVLAVEYHLYKDSTQPIHFDIISQFTVSNTSVLLNSLSFLNGTDPYTPRSGVLSNIVDMRTYTMFRPLFKEGTFFELGFENKALVPFNHYAFIGGYDTLEFDYHLEGQLEASEEWVLLDEHTNFNITDRALTLVPLPEGLMGWKHIRFVVDTPSVYLMNIMEFMLVYVSPHPEGMCSKDEDYFGVSSMEWSYSRCERGYSGFKRKQCINGVWSEEIRECEPNPLTFLHYPEEFYNFTVGLPFCIDAEMDGVATSIFSIPEGLPISTNGRISGIQTTPSHTIYTIFAMNDISVVNTTIEIEFHDTYCIMETPLLRLRAGENVTLPCSMFVKNTLGKFLLKCEYSTAEEGKWVQQSTTCITIGYVFGGVVVGICVLLIIIVMVVKQIQRKSFKKDSLLLNVFLSHSFLFVQESFL